MANAALTLGQPAPDFTLDDQDGRPVTLSSFRGKPVVLYFYPADDTPVCTRQACDFRDSMASLAPAVVLGVSPDDVASHARFRDRHGLPFTLLADPEHKLLNAYNIWRDKLMYGKPKVGVVRTTVLIDASGIIRRVWDGVKTPGHPEAVRAELAKL